MKCPECKGVLHTSDVGDILTIHGVYLTARCRQCGFKFDVTGRNDQNAIDRLTEAVSRLNRGSLVSQAAY